MNKKTKTILVNVLRIIGCIGLFILGYIFINEGKVEGEMLDYRIAYGLFFWYEAVVVSPILNILFFIFKKEIKWYEKLVFAFLGILIGYRLLFFNSIMEYSKTISDYLNYTKLDLLLYFIIILSYIILLLTLNKKPKARLIINIIYTCVILGLLIYSKIDLYNDYKESDEFFTNKWIEPKELKEQTPYDPYYYKDYMILENICYECTVEQSEYGHLLKYDDEMIIIIEDKSDVWLEYYKTFQDYDKISLFSNQIAKYLIKNEINTKWKFEESCANKNFNIFTSSNQLYNCHVPRLIATGTTNGFHQKIVYKDYDIVLYKMEPDDANKAGTYFIEIVTKNNSYRIAIGGTRGGNLPVEFIYDYISRISFTEEG